MNTWRYRCPNGHSNWQPRGHTKHIPVHNYYCDTCGIEFDELVDTMEEDRR